MNEFAVQSSEANFFPSWKKGPRHRDVQMGGKVHDCERSVGNLTSSPSQGSWSIEIDLAVRIHSCGRWHAEAPQEI